MDAPIILVTNDDGIAAPGIATLAHALESLGEVWVYAPDRNQSGVGHGVSLHRPLRVVPYRERWFSVDGTPTDCVMLAVRNLLPRPPRVVVSGINNGPNMGDDVTYSGTVAGAYEGMLLGVPSIAFSNQSSSPKFLPDSGAVAVAIVRKVLEFGLPADTVLNVNIPDIPYVELAGVAITRQGRRTYEDEIIHRTDPRGVSYYWIGGDTPSHVAETGTDFEAVEHRKVSVTPLHRNLTNMDAMELLKRENFSL